MPIHSNASVPSTYGSLYNSVTPINSGSASSRLLSSPPYSTTGVPYYTMLHNDMHAQQLQAQHQDSTKLEPSSPMNGNGGNSPPSPARRHCGNNVINNNNNHVINSEANATSKLMDGNMERPTVVSLSS